MIEQVKAPKEKNSSGDNNGNNGNGEGNGGGSGGSTNECVQTDNYKYNIEKENWNDQLALLDDEHNANLKKCLNTARDDIIKLIDDARDVKKKYSDEYKKLKDEYDCKLKNNTTDVGNIPPDPKKDLKEMLKPLQEKIYNLGQCKDKFNCIEIKKEVGQSTGKTSEQTSGEFKPTCPAYNYETFVSCDMSKYVVLDKKTEIKLECEKDKVNNLKPLQFVTYELEKSKRYNKAINDDYTRLKESQKNITDIFKQIDDYQKKIDDLSTEEDCKRWVYVLLIENLLIDSCHLLLPPKEFSKNLDSKIKVVEKAKKDWCYRTYNKNKTEALLKFATENYETLKKNFEKNALDRLNEE